MEELIAAAAGRTKADIVLKGGQVFNVFTGEFTTADVALVGNRIAGIGSYSGQQEIDVTGKYITPGFIDAHIHIESTLMCPAEFAKAVVPAGTTAVVTDPHEIANVCGSAGIRYMLEAAKTLPLTSYVMLPSCVPASGLENSGANLLAADLAEFINEPQVLGLGEMMNYPGVLNCDKAVMDKLKLAKAKLIEGHAPGLSGQALMAYAAAGISSDHECVTADEAKERLAAGMALIIREGSAAKSLKELLPVVNQYSASFCMFGTDDRNAADLIKQGHINNIVRLAVENGLAVGLAIQLATINPARYFGLRKIGAIAPGYQADVLVFDDLQTWQPELVIAKGKIVAEQGKALFYPAAVSTAGVVNTMNMAPIDKQKLKIMATSPKARVIGLVPNQIVTEKLVMEPKIVEGEYVADTAQDILKLVVFERHKATGNIAAALLHGFGLKAGAIASTIAHDSHNLIAVGTNDADILLADEKLRELQGGLAAVKNGEVLATMALPIAGLMSDMNVQEVAEKMHSLVEIARSLGVKECYSPYLTLAFLSLPVIPSLKLTDLGLVDGDEFAFVTTAVE